MRVRHVVFSDQPLAAELDGVEVVTLSPEYERRGVPRRLAIVDALRDANARVYIQRSAGFGTGVVGLFARLSGRRFVFSSSSEADFRLDHETAVSAGASLHEWPTRAQYRLGLRLATAIVVQTNAQRELARTKLGREAIVLPSFCAPAEVSELPHAAVFLWVGSLVAIKNPLAYVRLASSVPEARFWMIGTDRGGRWRDLAAQVRAEASRVPNLELLAPRPRDELLELYGQVTAVVNTSRLEGFPNSFLEAWARATPALSLSVDPDGVIAEHGLGLVAGGSAERLGAEVRAYRRDPDAARAAGVRARAYVKKVHDPAVVGERWAALVASLLRT